MSVNATPVNTVPTFELVMVNVSVDVPPAATGFEENNFEMEGGAMAVTLLKPVLFDSLVSVTLLLGSTLAVFVRMPVEAGVTLKLTTKLPPVPRITEPPFAVQANIPVVMLQLMLPEFVTFTKDPVLGVP